MAYDWSCKQLLLPWHEYENGPRYKCVNIILSNCNLLTLNKVEMINCRNRRQTWGCGVTLISIYKSEWHLKSSWRAFALSLLKLAFFSRSLVIGNFFFSQLICGRFAPISSPVVSTAEGETRLFVIVWAFLFCFCASERYTRYRWCFEMCPDPVACF